MYKYVQCRRSLLLNSKPSNVFAISGRQRDLPGLLHEHWLFTVVRFHTLDKPEQVRWNEVDALKKNSLKEFDFRHASDVSHLRSLSCTICLGSV